MLKGAADSVHGDTPLGYELSGNAALFRGNYKLVRNLPPTGNGRWRLFDIVADPGETRDLAAAMPDRFRSEEHTSELQSLVRISYAVFCLKKKNRQQIHTH